MEFFWPAARSTSAHVCVRVCVWVSLVGKRSGGGEKCTLTILPSLKEPVPKKYNISHESSFMAESVDEEGESTAG